MPSRSRASLRRVAAEGHADADSRALADRRRYTVDANRRQQQRRPQTRRPAASAFDAVRANAHALRHRGHVESPARIDRRQRATDCRDQRGRIARRGTARPIPLADLRGGSSSAHLIVTRSAPLNGRHRRRPPPGPDHVLAWLHDVPRPAADTYGVRWIAVGPEPRASTLSTMTTRGAAVVYCQ